MRKLGLCGIHPLTQRYGYFQTPNLASSPFEAHIIFTL
ncbi:hypothetical protein M2G33_21755 [Vibrio vulnificus]|nr:hypothetical protein [Vibrio vulnificus]